jgi:lipopolysaccharide transport system permease protein
MLSKRYLEITFFKAYAELRAEAARSYLGFIWWFMEPLIYLTVFYLVFEVGFRRGGEGFVSFLLCGLIVWKWLDSSVKLGSLALGKDFGLIQQVYFPKFLLPTVSIVIASIKFSVILLLYLGFAYLYHGKLQSTIIMLPVVMLSQLTLIFAVTWFVSAILPFVPDLKLFVDNAMTLFFFMSGIFFDISTFPEHVRGYFALNPMVGIIDAYRDVLIRGEMPDFVYLGTVAAISIVFAFIMFLVFKRFDRVYPKLSAIANA